MTTPQSLTIPRSSSLLLGRLAGLFRTASTQVIRPLPRPTPIVSRAPFGTQPPTDGLASLVRKATESFAQIERQARQRFGTGRVLQTMGSQFFGRDRLQRGLSDAMKAYTLEEVDSFMYRVAALAAPEVFVQLVGCMVQGTITLHRCCPIATDERLVQLDFIVNPVVPIHSMDHLKLSYWASEPLLIELYWYGSQPSGVAANGESWQPSVWQSTSGNELGYVFKSPLMRPDSSTDAVKRSLTIDTGVSDASFDLWVETANADPDPTAVKPPTVQSAPLKATPGIHEITAQLDPAAVDEIGKLVVDLVLEVLHEYQALGAHQLAASVNAQAVATRLRQ